MKTHHLRHTHHLNDKKGFSVGSLVQTVIATSIEIIKTAKDCAVEAALAGGGCAVTVAGIEHVMTTMIAVNGMATGIGDVFLRLMHFCVMPHFTARLIHSLSTVTLLLCVSLACNCVLCL